MTFRRAARIDNNQREIVEFFRNNGFHVLHIHQLKNCCDLIISKGLMTAAVEVKNGKGKLSAGEEQFKEEFKGLWYLCTSLEDAANIIMDLNEYIELLKVDWPEMYDIMEQ